MHKTLALASLLSANLASAFPWVSNVEGVDSSLFRNEKRQQPGSAATCPYNPVHLGAAPITAKYPYCGASGGVPGKQYCPNNLVPAKGDTAHQFTPPDYSKDIRGPCPGLNTAANHNFLSHDGITNFTELVDMQQNVYGVGYDLAVLLATLGVGLDGDPITEKLSIGCDATSRTASPGLGPELGLDGHNKFEGDTSLSRNDYFLADGDNYEFNGTLYGYMSKVANGNFSLNQLSLYRAQRYNQSRAENGNFYYGPKSLLLYGAASFLYELFPSLGNAGPATQQIENSFFGANQSGNTFTFNKMERIPPNWYSRATPYTIPLVANQINLQYQEYPVAFGGNIAQGDFVGFGEDGPYFSPTGIFKGNASNIECLLYQFATENQPSSLQGDGVFVMSNYSSSVFEWAASKLNPIYKANAAAGGFPCPLNYNNA